MNSTPSILENLVSVEKQIKDVRINADDNVSVAFSANKEEVCITVNGNSFVGMLDRPLMHQLSDRVEGMQFETFYQLNTYWKIKIKSDSQLLSRKIAEGLKDDYTILRTHGKRIYGIVTPAFKRINQVNFREYFLTEIKNTNQFEPISELIVDRFNRINEVFTPNFPTSQIEYKYSLVYGINNGYSAMKITWGRAVIVCSNGLIRFEGDQFKLKHDFKSDIKQFINKTVEEGILNYTRTNEQINSLQNVQLLEPELEQYLKTNFTGQFLQKKVSDRIKVEAKVTGITVWSLSQALTWMATHDSSINENIRPLLTQKGTALIENGLKIF